MIEKEFLEKLKRHNPFRPWENLEHQLQYKKKVFYGYNSQMFPAVHFHIFAYGDSIFIPMPMRYWAKKKYHFKKDNAKSIKLYNLKYRYMKVDPVCGYSGLRVWSFLNKPRFKRPRLVFKIIDK